MMVLLSEIREVRQRKCFSHLYIYKTKATTVVLLTENRRDWWGEAIERTNKHWASERHCMGSDCGQCSIPAFHSLATFSQYPRAKRLSIRETFCRAFPSNCRFFQQNRRISRTVLRVITLLASVSSHRDDANEKIFKRLAGLLRKIKTLNAQHIFWQISLPSACY